MHYLQIDNVLNITVLSHILILYCIYHKYAFYAALSNVTATNKLSTIKMNQ